MPSGTPGTTDQRAVARAALALDAARWLDPTGQRSDHLEPYRLVLLARQRRTHQLPSHPPSDTSRKAERGLDAGTRKAAIDDPSKVAVTQAAHAVRSTRATSSRVSLHKDKRTPIGAKQLGTQHTLPKQSQLRDRPQPDRIPSINPHGRLAKTRRCSVH